MTTRIAVFASGSGTNFQAIYEAVQTKQINAEIALVVTDKPEAFVVERAKQASIEVLALSPKAFATKAAYEAQILQKLQALQVEFIVLAGYMRLIGEVLLNAYPTKIVNIHPSLLPSFPGKDAIGQAMQHGVKVTGVTVHYVDAGMDTGQIIMQRAIDIVDNDRAATEEKIHAVEHKLYPIVLNKLFQ